MSLRNNDGLCRTCTKVDLHSLIKGRAKYTNRENEFDEFWDLPQVVKKRNCPLCRLLIRCFRTSEGFNFEEVGKFDRICGVYAGRELQLSISRKEGIIRSSYSIQNCTTKDNQVQEQLGEIKPICFDVEELRSWLNRCSKEHQQCNPMGSLSGKPIPSGFRLIDVERGCIVRAVSCPIYCALSYVWGSADQLVLKKCNLMELEKEYALFGEKFLLPKTITDAIKLCQDIGQKYLWVDRLCILQDEEEEKHNQIGSMDAVYNLAFLTIVAAAGDNANAGLSPFISRRPIIDCSIHVESISGSNFISSVSPILAAEALTRSKWATRGWTLQEYVLSKRSVIFSGQYVFFRCEEALWGEDFGLQLSSFCENWPGWDLPLYRFSVIPQSDSRHYSDIYPRLTAQYIRRVLTNQEDILDAFLGILYRLEVSIGPHLWGMPSKEFGSALLWSTSQSFPIKKRPSFPSWSWVGWIHTTTVLSREHNRDDMYYGFDSWDLNSSILKCFKLGDDTKIHCFEDNNIDRVFQIRLKLVREKKILARSSILIENAIEKHFTPPSDYEQILD